MQRVGNFTCFFTQSDMFSNWYRIGFSIDNIPFNCGEQAMMYYKAMLFKDQVTAQKILREPSARGQKALGRQVAGFSDAIWLQHREPIMEKIRSEEHTSELQSLMRISYAVFCLKKTNNSKQLLIILSYT